MVIAATLVLRLHACQGSGLQAFTDVRGQVLYSVHNSTFSLAMHGWREPLDRLAALAQQQSIRLATPEIGEVLTVGQPRNNTQWWEALR